MEQRPPPKGRAALIEAMKARVVRPGGEIEPTSEPPKPRGRAAFLNKIKELKIGATQPSEPVVKELPPVVETPEQKICSYQGTAGESIYVTANYIRLSVQKDKGVFEYHVSFNPELDSKQMRIKILNVHIAQMGGVKMYDGASNLYLPVKLPNEKTVFMCPHPMDATDVRMTVTFRKAKRLGECIHMFNVLFKRVMVALEYSRLGRNYFDTEHSSFIPAHKLEVLPGYAIAVDEYEGGLMICLDAQHRVLRTDTALDLLREIRIKRRDRFKDEVMKTLIGAVIMTKYNNKTYIIDDVLWDCTPQDTFESNCGKQISFIEYYKVHHGLTITDFNQPLLLHVDKKHNQLTTKLEQRNICLIPEFSYLTGLTDDMSSDYRVMKEVAQFTRISPHQRLLALRQYVENVANCPKAQQVLSDWGMKLEDATIDLNARILNPEVIVFGRGVQHQNDHKAEWSGPLARNSLTGPIDIIYWAIIFAEKDYRIAQEFAENMVRFSTNMGCKILKPILHPISSDKTHAFLNACNEIINSSIQVVVFIFPTLRLDLYSAIKKMCCHQQPIPSQVIQSRTLKNQKKVRTVTLKIALQITCKLGGSLWALKIPCKSWMVIGIDVYHSPANKSNPAVCAFVSNLNDAFVRWYSSVSFQDKEIGNHLQLSFIQALEKYREAQGTYPSKVIVFRDGVGDGQINNCRDYELAQFEDVIKQFDLPTQVCFVVVHKRINTRIMTNSLKNAPSNPPPGTVVDTTITRRHLYDYYLIPQNVTQGTVSPTHYIVVSDKTDIKPDHLQKLSYKLCHLYYNWSGTIRVPAPCQYAHKLAFLVGQHIGKVPSETLNNRLYYL